MVLLKSHTRSVLCLHVDDDVIVSGSEDKTLCIYDRRAGKLWKTLQVNVVTDLEVRHMLLILYMSRACSTLLQKYHSLHIKNVLKPAMRVSQAPGDSGKQGNTINFTIGGGGATKRKF